MDANNSVSPSEFVASCIEIHNDEKALDILEMRNNERCNATSSRFLVLSNVANERLKCEKEKSGLIDLQKQHMIEEHDLKIKQLELKNKILETILKKIQDDKPVDPELIKITNL